MRSIVCYIVSVSLHAAVLGALILLGHRLGFEPPAYGVVQGRGGGRGGEAGAPSPWPAAFTVAPAKVIAVHVEMAPAEPSVGSLPSAAGTTRTAPSVPLHRSAATEMASFEPPPVVAPPAPEKSPPPADGIPPLERSPSTLAALNVVATAEPARAAPGGVGQFIDRSVTRRSRDQVTGHGQSGGGGDGRPAGPGGGGLDQIPSSLPANPTPSYPPDALAAGIEGLVLLRVWIRADGSVQAVAVDRSSGMASLDESALTTVRDRWQFQPGRNHGAKVPCQVLLPIRFRLHDRP